MAIEEAGNDLSGRFASHQWMAAMDDLTREGHEDQLPRFAAKAFAIKRLLMVNPRQPTEADLLGILREAF